MRVLVTGGTGYIGSHTAVELIEAGHSVTIVDNLSNSHPQVIDRIKKITGFRPRFEVFDLCDKHSLEKLFGKQKFDAVIHFAGLKAVGESVARPLSYYYNNIVSTLNLCEAMAKAGVHDLVFSSSATVYGDPKKVPIAESAAINPTNPYGQTKAMIEQMLTDLAKTGLWRISLLRYFNPIGAHSSGLIGEDPNGTPNNLLPYVAQVAVGKLASLPIFGNDYDTPDGTCVRDYIHVVDIAKGHLAALKHLPKPGSVEAYNLGTGQGHSVLEVISAFEKASGKKIPRTVKSRRPGDAKYCYSNPAKANKAFSWKAEKSLVEACRDTWLWQSKNPKGFAS